MIATSATNVWMRHSSSIVDASPNRYLAREIHPDVVCRAFRGFGLGGCVQRSRVEADENRARSAWISIENWRIVTIIAPMRSPPTKPARAPVPEETLPLNTTRNRLRDLCVTESS